MLSDARLAAEAMAIQYGDDADVDLDQDWDGPPQMIVRYNRPETDAELARRINLAVREAAFNKIREEKAKEVRRASWEELRKEFGE